MKKFDQIIALMIGIFLILICVLNIYIQNKASNATDRTYKVSINRLKKELVNFETRYQRAPDGLDELDELQKYSHHYSYTNILKITFIPIEQSTAEEKSRFFNDETEAYEIFMTAMNYYKITYIEKSLYSKSYITILNNVVVLSALLVLGTLFFVRQKIIKPFNVISELPYQLSKGNLTIPVKAQKNSFFGRFLWGMDLLRENLEENKEKELNLIREKKMLLLSLSHDIKTPLSAIKLYSQALSKNLYKAEEKKKDISEKISVKVDEIESYISEIVHASNEEFLSFDVNNGEFYVKEVMEQTREYYAEKMQINQIDFSINNYSNCLVYGDKDRLIEVLQNIIENAIKYGDGRRISIDFSYDSEEYTINIINTGCDMEEKELVHIFDSFFRGSNVDKQPGSGLGLYICRQLMHLMEGGITAEIIKEEGSAKMLEVSVTVRVV